MFANREISSPIADSQEGWAPRQGKEGVSLYSEGAPVPVVRAGEAKVV